ncbi:MAG: LysR substrate-binding domain-containing protein, partial [Pseudomonadota bacterium]
QSLFGVQSFEPATSDTRFVIGATDYTAAILTPAIMQMMATRAPHATLSIRPADRSDAERLLADGEIDVALGMFPQTTQWIKRRRLYQDHHICVFNDRLVSLPKRLTMDAYVAQDHLLVSLDGTPNGFVDTILDRHGLTRRIAVTTPYFLQGGYLVEQLPVIATLPERFVRGCTILSKLTTRALPFEAPTFDVSLAWRAGDDRNPRLSALKNVVLEATRNLEATRPKS